MEMFDEEEEVGEEMGKGGRERKRRFTEEQIRSLESMFESQTKLEPRKKIQLARELGLQPRQVAIWFQNKRARWKSKQLEREFSALRSDYEALLSSYEALKKEKQVLSKQLQKLLEVFEKGREDSGGGGELSEDGKEVAATVVEESASEKEKKIERCITPEEIEFPGELTAAGSAAFDYPPPQFQDQQWWEYWPIAE